MVGMSHSGIPVQHQHLITNHTAEAELSGHCCCPLTWGDGTLVQGTGMAQSCLHVNIH